MRKPVGKRLLPPATVGALPLDSTDISVFKNLPITETTKVQCRAEFFDAFNTCGSIRRR